MDRSRGIILWVAGFAGVLLIYSAYKDKHPLTVLNSGISGATVPSGAASAQPSSSSSATAPDTATATPLTTGSDGYVYDANGNVVSQIPSVYAGNSQSYVPSKTHG